MNKKLAMLVTISTAIALAVPTDADQLHHNDFRELLRHDYLQQAADNAEQISKQWCLLNPRECAAGDRAGQICNARFKDRAGASWQRCFKRERGF